MEKNHPYNILGRRRRPVFRDIHGAISGDEGPPGVSSHRGVDLPPTLLTVRDLAVLLAASESAVYARHARGGIPGGIRLGRTLRFDARVIAQWLSANRASAGGLS